MDRQTILLISDMRQVYLAEILTKKGHNVRCLDIRNRETALQQLEKLKRFLDKADVLILPIPVQKVPEQEIFYDIIHFLRREMLDFTAFPVFFVSNLLLVQRKKYYFNRAMVSRNCSIVL